MTVVVNGGRMGLRQGSKAWKDLRACFITGSQFHIFVKPSHLTKFKKALAEKASHWKGGVEATIPDALQMMFNWGHFHEKIAREQYRLQKILEFPNADVSVRDSVAMMIDDEGMIAASPDGVVTITNEPPGVIEIKCPVGNYFFKKRDVANPAKYDVGVTTDEQRDKLYSDMSTSDIGRKYYDMDREFRIGGKLEEHYLQCIGNLHLSGAVWLDYIVYTPHLKWYKGSHMRVKRIWREETEDDWKATKDALVHAYKEHHEVFTENLERYLDEYKDTDFAT